MRKRTIDIKYGKKWEYLKLTDEERLELDEESKKYSLYGDEYPKKKDMFKNIKHEYQKYTNRVDNVSNNIGNLDIPTSTRAREYLELKQTLKNKKDINIPQKELQDNIYKLWNQTIIKERLSYLLNKKSELIDKYRKNIYREKHSVLSKIKRFVGLDNLKKIKYIHVVPQLEFIGCKLLFHEIIEEIIKLG